MDWKVTVFNLAGGLGIFIFGMKMMSDSLQMVAGERLKNLLSAVSSNRLVACLTGVSITAIIQSSSATTVMLVGFVNAGLMNLTQAVGVALGAKIGTTITAQLLAFKITEAALPAIAVGCFVRVFSHNRRIKELAGVLLGFGLLFYGIVLMANGVEPFQNSPTMKAFFIKFDAQNFSGIVLCVLVGMVCTLILQSSSVTVGLTMTLASQGLVTLPGAMALVIGDNIGTCITAELAAIGTDLPARRTARANSLASVIGATYMVFLFPFYQDLVIWVSDRLQDLMAGLSAMLPSGSEPRAAAETDPANTTAVLRYVANAHTIFNVINSLLFLAILPLLVKLAIALTPKKGYDETVVDLMKPQYLDPSSLSTPPVALSRSFKEIARMAEISQGMLEEVVKTIDEKNLKKLGRHKIMEEALDNLQREIHNYLIKLYPEPLTVEEHQVIANQMNLTNIIERVGDTTNNIADLIYSIHDNGLQLSDEAMKDYYKVSETALAFHQLVTSALRENRTDLIPQAMRMEEALDNMHLTMRDQHLERLRKGLCQADQGLIFTDILNQFERLGDYLLKGAKAWIKTSASGL